MRAEDRDTLLAEARLPRAHAALLLAIADGLCAIGLLRSDRFAGQFSVLNFLIRAAAEPENADAAGREPVVVLMRAGVLRRHAWYLRSYGPAAGAPLRLDLPGPLDKNWEWWRDLEEIGRRLDASEAWRSAVGAPVAERVAFFEQALESAEVRKIEP